MMWRKERFNHLAYLYFFLYLSLSILFYLRYVPLVPEYQYILLPLLLITAGAAALKQKWGFLVFIFLFPLINILPFLFGIKRSIPQAPASLILCLAFFLGWLLNHSFSERSAAGSNPLKNPMTVFAVLIGVSGLITVLRFANFFPFLAKSVRDLAVNVNGLTAGGAIMSSLFTMLSYLTGFGIFLIALSLFRERSFMVRAWKLFSLSLCASLIFALVQRYHSLSLGNTQFFVQLNRINGTFIDPNSFGIILAAALPILLGLLLASKGSVRILYGFLILLGLYVFPFIGSRSGLLSLAAGGGLFLIIGFLRSGMAKKKKIIFAAGLVLAAAVLSLVVFTAAGETNLIKRLKTDTGIINGEGSFSRLFNSRIELWNTAGHIALDNPVAGVGVGAFIVVLPNYVQDLNMSLPFTDSALNYFVQAGAELGFIGLLAAGWLFVLLIRISIHRVRKSIPGPQRFLIYGFTSGLAALVVSYFFQSAVGAFDIKYFFWILAAGICAFKGDDFEEKGEGRRKMFRITAAAGVIVFTVIFTWNSFHSLSISHFSDSYKWEQSYGLYSREKEPDGRIFHWTKEEAGISIVKGEDELIIPVKISHPDLQKSPVQTCIYTADIYFNKKRLLRTVEYADSTWRLVRIPVSELDKGPISRLVLVTSRTWIPQEILGSPDPRRLGTALGKVRFKSRPSGR